MQQAAYACKSVQETPKMLWIFVQTRVYSVASRTATRWHMTVQTFCVFAGLEQMTRPSTLGVLRTFRTNPIASIASTASCLFLSFFLICSQMIAEILLVLAGHPSSLFPNDNSIGPALSSFSARPPANATDLNAISQHPDCPSYHTTASSWRSVQSC